MSFHFDLTDLRLFLNVVDAGSITAGAEASALGLAAASARVQAMEASLGTALLTRAPRGVHPTAAGLALELHARTLLLRMERLHSVLSEHASGIKVQLRLLCDTLALHEVVPDRLSAFLLAHPGVNLLVDEQPSNEIVSALAAGVADVGIVRDTTDVFELESMVFCPDHLVIVTPLGHALQQAAAQGPVRLAQADQCDVVGLAQGTALQDLWDHLAAQRGRRLNYRIRVGSFDEQARLVARGAGIALMPGTTAARMARRLDLVIVPLAESFAAFSLRLCARNLVDLPPITGRLVGSLLGDEAPAHLQVPAGLASLPGPARHGRERAQAAGGDHPSRPRR